MAETMPQLSSDTKGDGSNVSERDLERAEREKNRPDAPQALHELTAKPIYDALRKVEESGIQYSVTSRYRTNSEAHLYDALDVKPTDPADVFKLASEVSKTLGSDYMVQVEEALPNGQQKNTIYSGGKQLGTNTGDRASGFTGTHVHIQTEKSHRPGTPRRGDRG
jgi:hypothetical protein